MASSPDWRNTQPRLKDIPSDVIHKGSDGICGGDPNAVITLPAITRVDYPASRDPAVTFGGVPRRMRGRND